MTFSVIPIFPIAIGKNILSPGLTPKQKNFIVSLEKAKNIGNLTSKDRYLTKHKILQNFTNFCTNSLNHYFKELYQPKYDVNLRITQMWANYSEKGQWHHPHEHPNSFISAVFYVNCEKDVDNITFIKKGYEQLQVYTENFNQYNSQDWVIPVEENLLVIFPSSLSHKVETVQVDKTRISISMNTFIVGRLGNDFSCTECLVP